MASPAVGQAEMLANEFEALLKSYAPKAVALVGCAGGNGFDKAAEAGVTRLVGIDINAGYIADAKNRYADTIPGLELHCADIQGDMPDLQAVELVYAALVFEYVDVPVALRNISRLCRSNGLLAVLLQLPKQGADAVTPSSFASLKELSFIMRLVPPGDLVHSAEAAGFASLSQKTITLQSGKQFSLQLFRLTSSCPQDAEAISAARGHDPT
ncbi:class I SAM-dependent methyltransferase [Variovorax sp. CF079]|uniref:class I SAM-dependent methyltransferase n=1 Tax=Variovorax sp. CF079 TaxID=1882774 RepID=UPI001BB03E24|nr:class I SAM-dependent methyltransferase [Variovorax sp. CF079]